MQEKNPGVSYLKNAPILPVFRIRMNFLRIRIRMEANTDPDPIRIQGFNDQKLKKITAEKKLHFFFDQKLQFTYP